MPPESPEHHEMEESDTSEIVEELHPAAPEFSSNPSLSSFLQQLGLADLADKFTEFGVSDSWLPLSKNLVRQLIRDPSKADSFLEFQSGFLLSEWPEDFSKRHMSFQDDCHPFETERELGTGGFGTVELVKDPITSKTYAMKVLPRPRNRKGYFKSMKMLIKEIAIMRQVKHHHCVELCASWTDVDSVSFLCSQVAEMDLEAFMSLDHRDGKQNVFLRQAVGCLCTALQNLHGRKIRHKDIKPRNILVYKSTVLLTDFGLSHDFSDLSKSTTTGAPAGLTRRYAAPEAISHEPRNRSSDIWGLGCVLIEMISCLRGHSLLEAKEFWKKNHALSFEDMHITARWCDMLRSESLDPKFPSSVDQQEMTCKDIGLLSFIQDHMLRIESQLRPSIGQVCEKLKDMDLLYPLDFITSWFGSCCLEEYLHNMDATAQRLYKGIQDAIEQWVYNVTGRLPAVDWLNRYEKRLHASIQDPKPGKLSAIFEYIPRLFRDPKRCRASESIDCLFLSWLIAHSIAMYILSRPYPIGIVGNQADFLNHAIEAMRGPGCHYDKSCIEKWRTQTLAILMGHPDFSKNHKKVFDTTYEKMCSHLLQWLPTEDLFNEHEEEFKEGIFMKAVMLKQKMALAADDYVIIFGDFDSLSAPHRKVSYRNLSNFRRIDDQDVREIYGCLIPALCRRDSQGEYHNITDPVFIADSKSSQPLQQSLEARAKSPTVPMETSTERSLGLSHRSTDIDREKSPRRRLKFGNLLKARSSTQ